MELREITKISAGYVSKIVKKDSLIFELDFIIFFEPFKKLFINLFPKKNLKYYIIERWMT